MGAVDGEVRRSDMSDTNDEPAEPKSEATLTVDAAAFA